ncbi:hypothetical protein MRB53_002163 [Persea americana]|uniref:Uncharacterized protein n=1 Tax=Persea americana TaxID=3435 RepID=A0ACC2MU06_PERAE|nr:hypothetical protein MRB53_002163 [Persea americana]
MSEEPPRIQYLHKNGKAFTLISIKNDNDIRVMIKACGEVTKSVYIYLRRNINDGADHYPSLSWPRTHATKHKKSKAIDHEGPPSRGLTTRLYCPGKSPLNFDVDAMSDVYRVKIGNIHEYTYPDVNLGEDTDKHFSYPTPMRWAFETNASPKDYNDDIDFNEDLDDVLN